MWDVLFNSDNLLSFKSFPEQMYFSEIKQAQKNTAICRIFFNKKVFVQGANLTRIIVIVNSF